jgi:hypothetical protein
METRKGIANRRFGLDLTTRDFRSIYSRARLTVQKLSPIFRPARIPTVVRQQAAIDSLKADFAWHMAQQKHMVQYDAAVFSVNQYTNRHWSHSGQPLRTAKRYYQSQLVCVWGAISVEKGWVFCEGRKCGAFKTDDTIRFFKAIGRRRDQTPLVMFGDNAKVHNNARVRDWCGGNDVDLLWNIPYRPEGNGIEGVWRIAKARYRAELARRLVNEERVDNLALVLEVLTSITNDDCKKEAMQGWQRLMAMAPVNYQVGPQ